MLIAQAVYLVYLLPYLIASSDIGIGYTMDERSILFSHSGGGGRVITPDRPLVVATRLHLGKATNPPVDLEEKMNQFAKFCHQVCTKAIGEVQGDLPSDSAATGPLVVAAVAVDATPKLDNYDLLQAVRQMSDKIAAKHQDDNKPGVKWSIHVVPVQPWGRFVPALNALVTHAASDWHASRIMFVSAETTTVGVNAVARLLQEGMSESVLVVGARLAGHDHAVRAGQSQTVALNGRTTPWNTLAVWNLPKLSLTGFQLISDGLASDLAPPPPSAGETPLMNMGGVEETVTIALLQKVLGPSHAVAKLIAVPDVTWNEKFDDPARQEWHDQKMASKLSRAQRQMDLLGLSGKVLHMSLDPDKV